MVYKEPSGTIVMLWHYQSFLTLSNIMWAIRAKWLELIDLKLCLPGLPDSQVSEGQLTYYTQAYALGLNYCIQIDYLSIEMVQGMSVLALYLMFNRSINR